MRRLRIYWLTLLLTLLVGGVGYGMVQDVPEESSIQESQSWDFSRGTPEGFVAAHSVAPLTVVDQALRARVTGYDPYFHSPRVNLVGERDRFLHIRLRATQGDQIKIYFTTPTGGWSEARSLAFSIVADGEFRDYWVNLGEQAAWRGAITQFRIDLEPAHTEGAILEIAWIRFFKVGPGLSLTDVCVNRGSVHPKERVQVSARLQNSGGEEIAGLRWRLVVSDGLTVDGPTEGYLAHLALGGSAPLLWGVEAEQAGQYQLDLHVESRALPNCLFSIPVSVAAVPPDPSILGSGRGVRTMASGDVVLEDETYRLVAVRSPHGYGQAILYGRSAAEWKRLAVLPPASLILQHQGDWEQIALIPTEAVLLSDAAGPGVVLEGSCRDRAGTSWVFRLTYEIGDFTNGFRIVYEACPEQSAKLLSFVGPQLLVGEGSFGQAKEGALFPGLEWLTAEEHSSSTLDAHPPIHLRVAPHPLKVTVPQMAVLAEGYLVGLMWEPNQQWADDQTMPTARFSSPNRLHNQENHWLGLSVPSVGEWVRENELIAETPYAVGAGETVRIEARIGVVPTDDLLTAADTYVDWYGLPDPGDPPRSWEEQRALMSHAYMDSYWDAEAQGWGHVYGWSPEPFPGLNEVLHMLADRETESEQRRAMLQRVQDVSLAGALRHGPGWLGTSAGGHITLRLLPFYRGFISTALDAWQQEVSGKVRSQGPDGHWAFAPDGDQQQALGRVGERALGLTATPAWDILRFARVTGDATGSEAGLKSLAAMRDFRVPRAAQTWEVPVHAPDILAAAKAVGAYVEGYRLTGDPAYLDDAGYWARAGLPFVYLWATDDRPVMKYATTAAFGATHFVLPWFGRPVQWNGLVYAYHLLELADYDSSFPWERVARGIVYSAMRQQRTEEPAKGGYPDVWELIPNRPIQNVDINPETIAKPAFYLFEDESPDIRTEILEMGGKRAHLNTVVGVDEVECLPGRLRIHLANTETESSWLALFGLGQPSAVRINHQPIPWAPFAEMHEQAWSYRSSLGGELAIKMKHAGPLQVDIEY